MALSWQPDQPDNLIVLANRDEFHRRPASPLGFWIAHPDICAGRDLEQGGTWLGMTRSGRFAALTNYRDPKLPQGGRSRGHLVVDFLLQRRSPRAYMNAVAAGAADYAGFNLLVADRNSLWYFSNQSEMVPRELPPGVYGLSNALLDTPWPKLCSARDGLAALLDEDRFGRAAALELMTSNTPADDADLPDTGVGPSMERLLSPRFIRSPAYGTRCTTIVQRGGRQATLYERRFDPAGGIAGESQESFALTQ